MIPSLDFETYSEAGFEYVERISHVLTPAARKAKKANPSYEYGPTDYRQKVDWRWEGTESGSKKASLPLVGARNYILHPTFEVLCMAYDMRDGNGVQLWLPGCPAPQRLLDHVAAGGLLCAWNSSFEHQVWSLFCTPRYGWPVLRLEQMRCSMARAAANGYPRGLDDCGEVLSLHQLRSAAPLYSQQEPDHGPDEYDDDIPL